MDTILNPLTNVQFISPEIVLCQAVILSIAQTVQWIVNEHSCNDIGR